MQFQLKRNDLLPDLAIQCLLDGVAVDLTTATALRFHMRKAGSTTALIDAAATLIDAVTGKLKYIWQGSDTATAGTYEAEFEVTFPSSKPLTFPNDREHPYIDVYITGDVA